MDGHEQNVVHSKAAFVHVIIPAITGGICGLVAQSLIDSNKLASPWDKGDYLDSLWNMHVALLVVTIPGLVVMALWMAKKGRNSEVFEFMAGGFSAIILAFLMSSMAGCGAFILLLFWFMASGSWGKHELPAFRLGVWWGLGLVVGAFSGALALDLRS
ncbi:MAG: hypothetical protein HOA04_00445 [Euryarchaeota archaeon]|jgi:hypothetical protein|nr:hypothetical protein [Euryarchaeota archaeon]MBT7939015.1 hypothetical protein [Euryarchaeota archaeon]